MPIFSFLSAMYALTLFAMCTAVSQMNSVLEVTVSRIDDTRVKSSVKNNGTDNICFDHLNFFGSSAPVKRISVFRANTEIEFEGVKLHFGAVGLTKESITCLATGEIVEDEVDLAYTTDLSAGGPVLIKSEGTVPIVTDGNITSYATYRSNALQLEIDGLKAAEKSRTLFSNSHRRDYQCNSQSKDILMKAISTASRLASTASEMALSSEETRFQGYFHTTEEQKRMLVSSRFRAVANEAKSGGLITYHCSDPYGLCTPNLIAYTWGYKNEIITCDRFYSQYSPVAKECDSADQATTIIHELTHVPAVYGPATRDIAYGYDAATQLAATEAVNNADNYSFYSLAVELQC